MSVLYGFDLLLPRTHLRAALEVLARHADPDGFRGCVVEGPEEAPLQLPFDAGSEDGSLATLYVGQPNPASWLHGSLWFPVDGALRQYLTQRRAAQTRAGPAGEEASIGLVSIFLHAGTRSAIVAVGAVTSSMSTLFEESATVRATMRAIAREAGAVATLLSRQPGEPSEALELPGRPLLLGRYDAENPLSVDQFVDHALRAVGAAQTR